MERKQGFRYRVSLSDLDNKDSMTHPYILPFPVNENDFKDLYQSLTDTRINEVFFSQMGFNYPPVNLDLLTVSFKVSYTYSGLDYTSEKLYFKYVKKNMAKEKVFLPYIKKIFGSSAKIYGFRVTYK